MKNWKLLVVLVLIKLYIINGSFVLFYLFLFNLFINLFWVDNLQMLIYTYIHKKSVKAN